MSEMTEQRAREILGDAIYTNGNLLRYDDNGDRALHHCRGSRYVGLYDLFTADELEAIAFWMRKYDTGK